MRWHSTTSGVSRRARRLVQLPRRRPDADEPSPQSRARAGRCRRGSRGSRPPPRDAHPLGDRGRGQATRRPSSASSGEHRAGARRSRRFVSSSNLASKVGRLFRADFTAESFYSFHKKAWPLSSLPLIATSHDTRSAPHGIVRPWCRKAPHVLRRQRALPLPRPSLRCAAVCARRRPRSGLAAHRRRGAGLRALAPALARARHTSTAGRGTLLVAWGAVLAAMNCCFYLAIDRLPLGTVAAIEFARDRARRARGADAAQRRRAGAGRPRRLPAHRRPVRGRAVRRRARVRQRRRCSRSTSCSATASRRARRWAASTGSPPRW